ncbi:MAG: acetate kinase [Firmicutes bacterium]|nr:acetate kinase [Bacillota bacterium]
MIILVVNCGSSSLKYQVLDMTDESVLCKGNAEKIGLKDSFIGHKKDGKSWKVDVYNKTHTDAFKNVIKILLDPEMGVIKSTDEIGAVGHRVLHGGAKFACSILVDDEVLQAIKDCIPLGPLHNPANLMGIKACMEAMPGLKNVAVFDTAFHQTMAPSSYMYGLPYEYYEKYGIRKYGFHGTSHRFVARRAAEFLGRDPKGLKLISCHIGSGASVCAIKDGKCVDTSMGLTPLEGLMMGTRCGDLDPAAITFIQKREGLTPEELDTLMNKKSGLLGIGGYSDARDIHEASAKGDERAKLAFEMFVHRVKNYIGAYMAELNGADALIFTAGLGENDDIFRSMTCKDMDYLGIVLDEEKNRGCRQEADITGEGGKVKILILPTNEELMIARDTYEIVTGK